LSNREEKVANLDNWSYEKVFKELNVVNDSEAFSLIEVLYNTFGFSKEDIPYFNEQLVFAAE